MSDWIKFSAVIPTYNRERTIGRAIESVLSQEYPAYEVIIVDDGSEDGTSKVVKQFGDKVRHIFQVNSGVASARNRGAAEARGDWIAFLDSDDYWLPQHLNTICKVIQTTKGIAALYFSDLVRPDSDGGGTHWEFSGFRISGAYEVSKGSNDWAMRWIQPMMLQSSAIRRSAYVELGGTPSSLKTREDTYLFHLLCLFYPSCAIAGCGAVVTSECSNSGRLTQTLGGHTSTFHECTKLLYKELLRHSNKMSEEQRKEFTKRLIHAHLNFGRVLMKKRKFSYGLVNLMGGFRINFSIAIRISIRIVRDYFRNPVKVGNQAFKLPQERILK